jgi:CheY-like chemotaxis protein
MPKILLVEDNEMNRDMLSRRLQRKGYSVVTAHVDRHHYHVASRRTPHRRHCDTDLCLVLRAHLKRASPAYHAFE